MTYARDKCFEREAVVDQRDVLKEALKHASGKAPSEQVSKAFDERINRGDFVAVNRERPGAPSAHYTPATIANERRNIEHMREGQNRFQPLVSGKIAAEAAQSDRLNPSQRVVTRRSPTAIASLPFRGAGPARPRPFGRSGSRAAGW